ncbi:MAG: ABC transporter permease subunit [candidate division Zixibacteria bacterium]|nr:ABC transporter permease subunit [candidate division Zixibacteria bacterium]
MFGTLVHKEVRAILLSPKFVATFAVCSLLILLSVYIGIREYQAAVRQYQTALQLNEQTIRQTPDLMRLQTKAFREPDPMQIFVSGVIYDVGRWVPISTNAVPQLSGSTYAEDTIFAVFRVIDFAFIIQVVLSLFAILFTFDAVSGEREDGTLRLVFANAVPRATYLSAKCAGAWLGLAVPLVIPILLSLLMVMVAGVPLDVSHWMRLAALGGLSFLLFTFFIMLGVLFSTLTRRPSISFLLSPSAWVVLVMIIPRAGTTAAAQIAPVPSAAEVAGIRDGYAKERQDQFIKDLTKSMSEVGSCGSTLSMKTHDSLRSEADRDIAQNDARVNEGVRNKRAVQERLAFSLARVSPAAAYHLAAMTIAGSDPDLKDRYEEAATVNREEFRKFVEKKGSEGGPQGIRIMASSETGLKIDMPREMGAIDQAELPRFNPPKFGLENALAEVIIDIAVMLLGSILAFGGAFAFFLRYDVR